MKQETLKNKFILLTGLLAGFFVLGLVIFSPSQNASALSVGDEVQRRLTEAAVQEEVAFVVSEMLEYDERADDPDVFDQGYVLSEEEKTEFFSSEFTQDAGVVVEQAPAITTIQPESDLIQEEKDEVVEPFVTIVETEVTDSLTPQENVGKQLEETDMIQESAAEFDFGSASAWQDDDSSSITTEENLIRIGKLIVLREVDPIGLQRPTLEPTKAPTKTPLPTDKPTAVPTKVPTSEPTEEPAPVPTTEPTVMPTEEPTPEPTEEPTPMPLDEPDVFWDAGFETGNISEWTTHGDWLRQGNTATYQVQTNTVHSGDYAVKFTIDTSSGSSQAAYLFYWDELPNAAYYSAWYYIPGNIDTNEWWNIMQWKSTYNGNTDYSRPIFVLDGALFGQTALSLCYLPDRDADKQCWKQTKVDLPQDQWVHIEVYYQRDKKDGHVIVWQDGNEIFNITGYPTVLSDGTLYYSVNHYTDRISPTVSSIYIDDVMISYDRIWPYWE